MQREVVTIEQRFGIMPKESLEGVRYDGAKRDGFFKSANSMTLSELDALFGAIDKETSEITFPATPGMVTAIRTELIGKVLKLDHDDVDFIPLGSIKFAHANGLIDFSSKFENMKEGDLVTYEDVNMLKMIIMTLCPTSIQSAAVIANIIRGVSVAMLTVTSLEDKIRDVAQELERVKGLGEKISNKRDAKILAARERGEKAERITLESELANEKITPTRRKKNNTKKGDGNGAGH